MEGMGAGRDHGGTPTFRSRLDPQNQGGLSPYYIKMTSQNSNLGQVYAETKM